MSEKRKKTAARLHLLTARQVLNASDGDLSDGGGLLLRVRGGSASWVLRYTAPSGRRREMGLGVAFRGSVSQAGDTLTDARLSARKARDELSDGSDPIDARDARREVQRQAEATRKAAHTRERWTLARSARDYHERVIEPTKTAKHAAQWIASLENHLPAALWGAPMDEATPPELLRALLAITPHVRARRHEGDCVPETMRRIRQRLDAVFEDGIFHGRCTTNPAAAIRRKLQEAMPREKTGAFAALPYHDAPPLMSRLRQMAGVAARCLELAVLTASRTNEVLELRWRELDLDAGVWIVPAERMKAREDHTVFLSRRAVEILRAQRELRLSDVIVFPSPVNADAAMSNMALLAVLSRLGVRDKTTVHGLCRSTFSTWANEVGAARPDAIEACLAHGERDKVRAAYNRAQFAVERRSLLAKWATFLEHESAQLIPFDRAA